MATTRLLIICGFFCLLAGCTEELPPSSVTEFLENRILLEATMVRCGENRSQKKYEADCVNAREAINRIAAEESRARRAELQAQFERKRRSLRRTQEAAAEARRRADEARRIREEAEYLGIYDESVPRTETADAVPPRSDEVTPKAEQKTGEVGEAPDEESQPDSEAGQDLEAIREELRRRQDSD